MIIYLLKIILASGLFLAIYYLLLERNINHQYKRFYLLVSVLVSLAVPFMQLPTIATTNVVYTFQSVVETIQSVTTMQSANSVANKTGLGLNFLWLGYILVSMILLGRFTLQLRKIFVAKKAAKKIETEFGLLYLLPYNVNPHSFYKYIFLSENDYNQGRISQEILVHEQYHISQNHTLDIIFVELLTVLFWVNPFLYLYKKAIKLNHEFLADKKVTRLGEPISYMQEILSFTQNEKSLSLTSNINFHNTKKRFIMITRKTNRNKVRLAMVLSVALFASSIYAFTATAQVTPKDVSAVNTIFPAVGQGASPEDLKEYDQILAGMMTETVMKNGKVSHGINMSKGDVNRLAEIFSKMNEAQQNERIEKTGVTVRPNQPPAQKAPTALEINDWKMLKNMASGLMVKELVAVD